MRLSKTLALLKRFVQDEDGLEMVEWGIIAVLVTGAGAVVFQLLGLNTGLRITQLQLYTLP